MADSKSDSSGAAAPRDGSQPDSSKPVVLIPVLAEDVERENRRRTLTILAAVIVLGAIVYFAYRRITDPVLAKQAFDAGVRLIQATRYEQAVLNFDRALALKSDLADAYRMRARSYVALNKPDLAIADFSRFSAFQPKDAIAIVDRGFAYLDKKDYDRAIADANRAIEIDPKLGRAYNLRAAAIRAKGSLEKAVADYTTAISLDPNLDNYFQRAATYQMLGQHQNAVADLDQAVAYAPDQPHVYFARAESRAALGDTRGANEDIRTGRKIDGW